jgi:chemotaxis protein CheY-P-specific phosphatase CheC
VIKLSGIEKEEDEFVNGMLEQILRTAASKSLISLQFFIGRLIQVEALSIHWTGNIAQQLRIEKDFTISKIELREDRELVGSIYLIFPYEIAYRLAKDMYGELIPEIFQKHVLDLVEEMTNIISAPLSEALSSFLHQTVIPSIARIVSYDEFKSLLVAEVLILELKMGDRLKGTIYFVMEELIVKKLMRMLKMRKRI